MKFLYFDFSTVLFWYFGICFLITLPLCFAVLQFFFWSCVSCFVQPDAHSRSIFNCLTAQLFGSYVLLVRQLSFDISAVVFDLGNCFFIVRQLFFEFRQLCFDLSAVFICWVGSCFLPVRLLFLLVQHEVETWNRKR